MDFDSPGNVSCFAVPIPCSNGNTVQGVSAELPTGLQFVSLAGRFWGTGYSGATNVLTTFVPKADLWVAFQAAPGYRVRVEEFTLAPRQGGVQASQPFRANGVLGWTGDLSTATTFAAAAGGAERSNTFTLQSTYNRADIAIDSITVSVTAVPEPGSWALMAAGLALLGGLLRGQRRSSGSQD
ncbi:MAG: PEP-CTERM sorting domain-containing protein [Roseateles asaccharophilus]|uniref:PEP-CTERM sorting domain-containing protein n=1 Tax=Roseateles asaccharophilus TaxID=582607 RepID=UPI001FE7CDBF|nr:PEP-CTERM sorting domain-containing protein [Roseateles asaccharophilus]MDN3544887.1 PEP-CTERM sorting domain-containing protein [Roseateles asaccharophilus]